VNLRSESSRDTGVGASLSPGGRLDAPQAERYLTPKARGAVMSRTVFCKRLKKEAPGLEEPPMFGKIGREVFEHVSAEAWAEWEEMQLKIVNEYHLDLADKEARKTLTKQMRIFLGLEEGEEGVLEVGTPTEESGG
jgi:Fe-S cluster biosynthesis and repair protein YggX